MLELKQMMNFRTKILEAIKVGKLKIFYVESKSIELNLQLLFQTVFPTDINQILFEYFYNQSDIKTFNYY